MTVLLWAVSTERQFKVSTFFGNQGKTAELKMTSGTKRDQLGSTASQKWWRSSAKKRVCPKRTQTTAFERQPLLSGPMQGFQIATSWPFEAIAVNSPCWATLNSRPSTSKLDNCSHVLSRALSPSTSNHSQLLENFQQSLQLSVSVRTKQVPARSLFGNCTIQNLKMVFYNWVSFYF